MVSPHSNHQADPFPALIDAYLKAPPLGTPPEILDAVRALTDGTLELLTPHLFREVVDQTPMAVSVTDRDANILFVNRAFEQLTGYPRSELLGQNESLLSNGATPREVYRDLWRTVSKRHTWKGKLVNRRKDGGEYLAELNVAPVVDGSGQITHFLGIHRDITDLHRLERRNAHQTTLLETMLDAAPVVLVLVDRKQRVLLDNQEYRRLRQEFEREPFQIFRQGLADQHAIDLAELCDHRRPLENLELRLEGGAGGPRWFSCSGSWMSGQEDKVSSYFSTPDQSRPCFLLLANEITTRKREVEQARLEHLRASLAEEQLAAGMREALAAALFQLQGPLNVIEAAVGMLDAGGIHPEALRPMLNEILHSGRATLDSLRAALPESEPVAEEPVNLNEVLHEVLQLATTRLLTHGVVVDWRPESVLPAVTGSKRQLRSLFNCLLENAILAVAEGRSPNREVRIQTRLEGDCILTEIEDSGAGIPQALRLRVFEPFFSGWRQRRQRAGMGLAMAREIALRHGGGVEIDESFRDGCRMRVELPIRVRGEFPT